MPVVNTPLTPSHPSTRYAAYLLRFWSESGQDAQRQQTWRFSLEDPHSGARRGFASLAELVTFLEGQIGESRGA